MCYDRIPVQTRCYTAPPRPPPTRVVRHEVRHYYEGAQLREYLPERAPRRIRYVPLEMQEHDLWPASAPSNHSHERGPAERRVTHGCDHHERGHGSREDIREEVREDRATVTRRQREADPAPRIRFVHVQGDDVVIKLTGARNYCIALKTRMADLVVDAHHPDCVVMTPFKCHIHLPHAQTRLLGARVRAVPSSAAAASAAASTSYEWSPWHPVGEAKFGGGDIAVSEGYSAPHFWRDGSAHYWSGAAPWRQEVYGGDEPTFREDREGGDGGAPGPGAYDTPSFLTFGGGVADGRGFDYTPSSGFCSNTKRDDNAQSLWRTAIPREQAPTAGSAMNNPGARYRTFRYNAQPPHTSLRSNRPASAKY